ncbi:MAG: hypothetical protein ABIQ16_12745 [Polyangiaceae bacterium]
MGLDRNGTKCILYAKKAGVDFSRAAHVGRQDLNVALPHLKKNIEAFGHRVDDSSMQRIYEADQGFADEFFRFLGAGTVESFDASNYEGATHIHDMNQPIGSEFKSRYSLVLDSGTLEHVFNFPVALKNCMEMVEVGGHYLGITPTNNFSGHGFYQFSPELFFGVFAEKQGFELQRLIAFEDRPNAQWYEVQSPAAVNARITLRNKRPSYLFVIAKRTAAFEPFRMAPQQTDYVAEWALQDPASKALARKRARAPFTASLAERTRKSLQQSIRSLFRLGNPIERFDYLGFSPSLFRPINPTADHGRGSE